MNLSRCDSMSRYTTSEEQRPSRHNNDALNGGRPLKTERRCINCGQILDLVNESEWDSFEEVYFTVSSWICDACGLIHEEMIV
jgi:Pyruvate/2-oxoacid:ferredoxin oxidoreductase delta subunit